jgi:hypothetical protein
LLKPLGSSIYHLTIFLLMLGRVCHEESEMNAPKTDVYF